MIRVDLSDEKGWLPRVWVNGEWTNLASWMASVEERLEKSSTEPPATTGATSPASSAQSAGPATKLSESSTGTLVAGTENPVAMWWLIRQAITDYSRSTESTSPASLAISIGSSTLQLTFTWHTNSGSNEDGNRGHVDPEPESTSQPASISLPWDPLDIESGPVGRASECAHKWMRMGQHAEAHGWNSSFFQAGNRATCADCGVSMRLVWTPAPAAATPESTSASPVSSPYSATSPVASAPSRPHPANRVIPRLRNGSG